MKKQILFLFLFTFVTLTSVAQKGTKIGYIDMEYILENVTSYKEAQMQLDNKSEKWKQDIQTKQNEINKLTEALKAEKPLLTRELIEERDSEIKQLEKDMLDYQQKRFGPGGDLIIQKTQLAKPIQDQVFTAVQEIAEAKKYDFIFDRASDLTMLFAAKRYDISDNVLRVLNKIEKTEKLSKKQQKEEEIKEQKQEAVNDNPLLADRQKALDDKKAEREKAFADRRTAAEEKRKQILAEREAKKNGTVSASTKTVEDAKAVETIKTDAVDAKQAQIDKLAKSQEDRNKIIEDRKKAVEERRKKALEDREAAKKAKQEKLKEIKSITN